MSKSDSEGNLVFSSGAHVFFNHLVMEVFNYALDHTGSNSRPINTHGRVQVYMSLDRLKERADMMRELINMLVRDGEGNFTGDYQVHGEHPRRVSPNDFATLCAMAEAIGLLVRVDANSAFLAYRVPQPI